MFATFWTGISAGQINSLREKNGLRYRTAKGVAKKTEIRVEAIMAFDEGMNLSAE
jgi:hypothetical protein